MNRIRIDQRLAALESQVVRQGDPHRIHDAMLELGHDTPLPRPGQTVGDWLHSVPNAALEALLEARP